MYKSDWKSSDYLLYGRYCETSFIADAVDEIRAVLGAEAAVLIAFRDRTLFHSLLAVAHRSPPMQAEYQKRVLSAPYLLQDESPAFLTFDPEEHDPGWLLDGLVDEPGFLGFRRLFADSVRVISRRPDPRRAATRSHPLPASFHLLVGGAREDDDVATEMVDALVDMINASAPVVVHGNLEAEREVHAELGLLDRDADEPSTEMRHPLAADPLEHHAPARLLEAAMELTASSVGSIYFDTRDGQQLKLAVPGGGAAPPLIEIADQHSVVAWVYRRKRPMVVNDVHDFVRLRPAEELGMHAIGGGVSSAYAELAVPILQSSSSTGAVVGVLDVEKVDPVDSGHYTYRDLVVLRMLAGRIGLWRSQELLSRFSRSLASLTHRNTVSAAVARVPERDATDDDIPADALAGRDAIEETVESIYELTRSHSVTVRLLIPRKRALIRFCAYPSDRLADDHRKVKLRVTQSINAWVARTGKPCYVPNVRHKHATDPYPGLDGHLQVREQTQSELCLPIVVGGRLVGTFNLESPYRDGYAGSMDIAMAVAEQVALSLEQSRRAQEQTVFSMTAATAANAHQLLKYVSSLQAEADDEARVREIAEGINGCVDTGAQLRRDVPATTMTLLQEALEDLKIDHLTEWRSKPPISLTHSGPEALVLRTVFGELLRNAHAAAMRTVPLSFAVDFREMTIGGKRYLSLRIHNPIRRWVPEASRNVLFRAPVRRDGERVHIGAFAAAALVRSIGGDVYVDQHHPPHFVVGVDLPVATDRLLPRAAAA
jgi:GAF domain-containing protein